MTRRVAVTTTAGRSADRVSRLLEAAGLAPILLPCIRVESAPSVVIDEMRRAAEAADWIVLTSQRAVEIMWPEEDMPSGPAIAAVGRASAAAVHRSGGRPRIVGTAGAADLCDRLRGQVDGATVVFPHAAEADPTMAQWLEGRVAHLAAASVYRTVSIPPAGDPVDAVLFASPSAVDGWCSSRNLEGLVVGVIGSTTAAHLEAIDRAPDVVADRPDLGALVQALAETMSDESRVRS